MRSPLGPRAAGVLCAAALASVRTGVTPTRASVKNASGAPGFNTSFVPPAWPTL